MKQGLTEKRIRDARPKAKRFVIWDEQLRGLGVKVFETGLKTYVVDYRLNGRRRRATLARCNEISLHEARTRAARELAAVREGKTDMIERRREAREAPTVADAVKRFLGEYAERRIANGRMTERTRLEYGRQYRGIILPALGKLRVADVTRWHVERMVDPLTRYQRNRVLALTSRLFTVCEHWEWRDQRSNPARGIERAVETARDRVLSVTELAALASALDSHPGNPAAVAAIRFAALTGLRIGEVLAIRWEHVDFETGRLIMPETKTGRRVHDLPDPALDVLARQPRINGNPWAFTTGRSAAVTYHTVQKVFADATRAAGLEDVRLHDLRRTLMTSAARAGVGSHVLRDLLGHKTTAIADRYIRDVGESVRDARRHVADVMADAMAGRSGNVVPLRRRDA